MHFNTVLVHLSLSCIELVIGSLTAIYLCIYLCFQLCDIVLSRSYLVYYL